MPFRLRILCSQINPPLPLEVGIIDGDGKPIGSITLEDFDEVAGVLEKLREPRLDKAMLKPSEGGA